MVLTPKFRVNQDDTAIIIEINVPYIKVSNAEVIVDGQEFSFFCSPYLLKLSLPKEVLDEEGSYQAKYDPNQENGLLSVNIRKKVVGEFFPNLDLLSSLMQSRKIGQLSEKMDSEGNIEILHSENFVDEENSVQNTTEDQDHNYTFRTSYSYGFNDSYSNLLRNLSETMYDMIEIQSPEMLHPMVRREQRIRKENELFDPYRYLGDLEAAEEDMLFQSFLKFTPFWQQQWILLSQLEKESLNKDVDKWSLRLQSFERIGGFDEKEKEILFNRLLSQKREILPPSNKQLSSLLYGLVDILFSLCYDHRLTSGEYSSESCYNITRLSATLSWVENYANVTSEQSEDLYDQNSIQTIIFYSFRRLLIYPYLRHWKLGRKVLGDVVKLFLLGKRPILRLLLQLYDIYEHTDTHYLLNNLYIRDYCLWLQETSITDEDLYNFGKILNESKTLFEKDERKSKYSLGFNLNEIELWASSIGERADESERKEEEEEGEEESEEENDSNEVQIPSTLLNFHNLVNGDHDTFAYLKPSIPSVSNIPSTPTFPVELLLTKPSSSSSSSLKIVELDPHRPSSPAEGERKEGAVLMKEVKTTRKNQLKQAESTEIIVSQIENLSLDSKITTSSVDVSEK
mmetsp:Transcript_30316/g.33063  ORF Transcript_30316/g.33063 Transcript_30316/m.33063 type:complete len:626 (+) Transcript_30316:2-1879(+)|eukprot:gene2245-2387_t